VLKGHYTTLVFSIIIHLIIFFFIAQTQVTPPNKKQHKTQPIKSFLYVPQLPIVEQIKEVKEETSITEVTKKLISVAEQVEPNKDQKQENTKTPTKIKEPPTQIRLAESEPTKPENLTTEQIQAITPPKKSINKYSALKQLSQLQNKLEDKMFENEAFEYSRPKTGSVMHGTPIPAPTSVIPLTPEQKKEKNTSQYGSGTSITKNDDGSCTIVSDLGTVGMEGLTAVSGSSCGESKEQKNFRLHMDKVLKKLGKK